ncbi:MAG: membrane-bound lytic murein transglycosylase MltF [Sulfuricella sp.]|nr:membrane-bound lytic murein transglycosylase MltF [Sulfuricella sp.]
MKALFSILWVAVLLSACDNGGKPVPPFRESGELVVITRNSPTTYYEDAQGQMAGIENDLATLFAGELGLKVRFVVAPDFSQILPMLQRHQGHFAAAGLTVTPAREKIVRFGPAYQTVQQQLAYSTFSLRPAGIKNLVGKRIEVVAGSSYAERLRSLKEQFPQLRWEENSQHESEELLEHVADGLTDYVVADSHVISVVQNYRPNLDVAFSLGKPEKLAWAFPLAGGDELVEKAQAFFERITQDGTLRRLLDRYYGHLERLEGEDIDSFLDKMNSDLPEYRKLFQRAQELTDIDWRLLAALGYQESHWDPLATSPTGVRGLMMLTADTADQLGVSNRLDPRQNIPAGARYLQNLKDTLPGRIGEPDRTWIALAAYNTGQGHVEDARVLAQQMKLDPDSWTDLKKSLPLLTKPAYYKNVKHGYARGGEAVIFTESTRTYYDILVKFEKPYKPGLNSVNPERYSTRTGERLRAPR